MDYSIPYEIVVNGNTEKYVSLKRQIYETETLKWQKVNVRKELIGKIVDVLIPHSVQVGNRRWETLDIGWTESLVIEELGSQLVEISGQIVSLQYSIEDYREQIKSLHSKER